MKQLKNYKLEDSIKREGIKVLDLSKEDVKLLKSCKHATSKEEYRPILKYIHIDKDNFVALDGYRLALRKHNLNISTEILVHPEILNLGNIETIEVYEDTEKYYYIINNAYCYSIDIYKDTYINYNFLIPELEKEEYITLNKKDISNILKNKELEKVLTLETEANNLNITDKLSVSENININNLNNKKIKFGINKTYLKQAISKTKNKNFKMYLDTPISPVILGSMEYMDLVLPIKINC